MCCFPSNLGWLFFSFFDFHTFQMARQATNQYFSLMGHLKKPAGRENLVRLIKVYPWRWCRSMGKTWRKDAARDVHRLGSVPELEQHATFESNLLCARLQTKNQTLGFIWIYKKWMYFSNFKHVFATAKARCHFQPRLMHEDGHGFPNSQPRATEIYQRVIQRMRQT